ncbi:dipeptidase [Aquisediminimonas profunda]|uniref:dipeptidase n=1 Tax=Aquisediminimonas profunda TaxID=1550733 RepID=UPI001C631CF8|nr:dipeptidase [Aquisediminimonas profunda]
MTKISARIGFTFALVALASPVLSATPEDVARAALARSPVVDGHNDVPEQLRSRFGNDFSKFDFHDMSPTASQKGGKMHTDLARLRKGMVGGQFWSVWVSTDQSEVSAVREVTEQIDVVERLVAAYPKDLMLAKSADDIEAAFRQRRIASLIGMEGGHSIGSSLAVLRQMYRAGARYMTITHSKNTPWADSATDAPKSGGLAPFGVAVVKEMNRLGMLVDISHVSEKTMMDVLDTTAAPVIFSHSGARAIDGHARNVPDSVLARLKTNGGIVMQVLLPDYVSEEVRQWEAAKAAEEARSSTLFKGDPAGAAGAVADWIAAHPRPHATISQVADHIDHIREIAGIDHIGIGGDFDGMDSVVDGLGDVSTYPALFAELARRGYSQQDLEKIACRNLIRVFRATEAVAKAKSGESPSNQSFGS